MNTKLLEIGAKVSDRHYIGRITRIEGETVFFKYDGKYAKPDEPERAVSIADARTEMSCTVVKDSPVNRVVSFGVADKKGRELGTMIGTGTATWAHAPAGHRSPADHDYNAPSEFFTSNHGAGLFYWYSTQSQRGGASYGASTYHSRHEFTTAAARDAAIEKYLKGAKRNADKVAAKA